MRDIATMHADVIAQKPARLGRSPTLLASSWGAPYYLQLCAPFIQPPPAWQTPPAVPFQMGYSSGHSSIVTCFSAVPFEYRVGIREMQNRAHFITHSAIQLISRWVL